MSTVGKDDNWMTQKRLNSVFATAQLGYREGIFLDISARNDWFGISFHRKLFILLSSLAVVSC